MKESNAIEIVGLCKSFSGFYLNDINFELKKGTIMGLIGENGSGKTTLINCILGYLEPDRGSIKILGESLKEKESLREDIGIVFNPPFFPTFASGNILNEIYKRAFINWDEEYFRQLASKFRIDVEKKFCTLSKGSAMKLNIALALSHKPKLLILDEPTGDLDPVVRDEFLDIIYDYVQDEGNSVLISSNIVSDLEKVCDYITFLHEGAIILSSNKDILKESFGIISMNDENLSSISKEAIIGKKINEYSTKFLVNKDLVNKSFVYQVPSLEDLFIYIIKRVEE